MSRSLLSGLRGQEMSGLIHQRVSTSLEELKIRKFNNGESRLELPKEALVGKQVGVVMGSGGCGNENDAIMEILLTTQTARLNGARRTVLVAPLFFYIRQDKPEEIESRVTPMAAKIVADQLKAAGVDHVITMDLHSAQMECFFSMPITHLSADSVKKQWLTNQDWFLPDNVVLVAPDAGAAKRVSTLASEVGVGEVMLHKFREKEGTQNEIRNVVLMGDVKHKIAVIDDDIADSCGTVVAAAERLKEAGALRVIALITHGVFSGEALQNFKACEAIEQVVVTNTICQEENKKLYDRLTVLDTSKLFADAFSSVCDLQGNDHLE